MSQVAEIALQRLVGFSEVAGKPVRFVIAFSGGLDSTVLTHILANNQEQHGTPIIAVYVDHGLHAESAGWRDACAALAKKVGVDFISRKVEVDLKSGRGPEASAREARYAALRTIVEPGDWLLSAHHEDDQAETLILGLMRGSGPAGMAGIGAMQRFGTGWLARPLLDISRDALHDYATTFGLTWIDDPSNQNQDLDRNYLRHEVMPRLDARWTDATGRLRRSAQLAGEAAHLLSELAEIDSRELGDRPDRLALDKLRGLSLARQRNVLRHIIREMGLPVPGASRLQSIVDDLIPARDDAQPLVRWPGAEVRRYRNELYIVAENPSGQKPERDTGFSRDRVEVGPGLGSLVLMPNAPSGLSDEVVRRGLKLGFREGGEDFRPAGRSHTRKLKKLLQEAGVVPWMRARVPLLFSDGQLVAVADLWIAADASSKPGTAVYWEDGPQIY